MANNIAPLPPWANAAPRARDSGIKSLNIAAIWLAAVLLRARRISRPIKATPPAQNHRAAAVGSKRTIACGTATTFHRESTLTSSASLGLSISPIALPTQAQASIDADRSRHRVPTHGHFEPMPIML